MSQSSLHKTLVASLCNFLTAGAIVAGGSGLSLWEKYLGLAGNDSGWLNSLSANGAGAAIGALLGGFLADKYGRRNVFTYNTLVYMFGVLLICTASSFNQLLLGFVVTGIAAGISVPSSWTYICECSGPDNRGRNMALSQLAWGLGPAIVLMFSTLMAPGGQMFDWVVSVADSFGVRSNHTNAVNVYASRIVFASLFVISFITWLLQRRLEPSDEWLQQKDSIDRSKSLFNTFKVFTSGKYRVTFFMLINMYLTWNIVASLMGFFQQHIYETAGNLSNLVASQFMIGQWFLTCILTLIGAFYIDKFEHRKQLVGFLSFGCLAWLMLIVLGIDDMPSLYIITFLWAAQAGVSVQLFFALWGVELFPFIYRATAIGFMFFIVRIFSAVANFIFSALIAGENVAHGDTFLEAAGSSILMLLLLIVSGYIGWKFAPETRNKSLSQISDERYGEDHTKEHYGE